MNELITFIAVLLIGHIVLFDLCCIACFFANIMEEIRRLTDPKFTEECRKNMEGVEKSLMCFIDRKLDEGVAR